MLTLQFCLHGFPFKGALKPNFTLTILFKTYLFNTRRLEFNILAKIILIKSKLFI